jgi:hypothetical protein
MEVTECKMVYRGTISRGAQILRSDAVIHLGGRFSSLHGMPAVWSGNFSIPEDWPQDRVNDFFKNRWIPHHLVLEDGRKAQILLIVNENEKTVKFLGIGSLE